MNDWYTIQPAATQSSPHQMNQMCKVCGEPAAGFHFGAFTCEGCKSFFGRSYNNLSSISECKNGGQCVINKKNRTSCKACRLRKCLVVGMSKSGSRYGRRSNWFKIHCLLQEQANNNNNGPSLNAELKQHVYETSKSPPAAASRLLQQQFAASLASGRASLKHEDDDYKTSSPSISSPESHNSDSSVEISDARLGLLNTHLAAMRHSQNKSSSTDPKDFFMPLPFLPPALMQSSPFAAAAAAAMAAQHAHKFLFPGGSPPAHPYFGLYPPPTLPLKEKGGEGEEMMHSKRFYLDAILQSQRASSLTPPVKTVSPMPEKLVVLPEKLLLENKSPSSSPPLEQDNPMDLSMKSGRGSRQESALSVDSDEEFEEKSMKGDESEVEEHEDKEEVLSEPEIDEEVVHKTGKTTPLDLTTRLETAD